MSDVPSAQGFVRQLATELQLPTTNADSNPAISLRSNGDENLIEVAVTITDDSTVELAVGSDLDRGPSLQSPIDVRDDASFGFVKEIVASALLGKITESTTRQGDKVVKYELKSPMSTMNEQPGMDGNGETETRTFLAYPAAQA